MTILFHPNIRNLMINQGLMYGFPASTPSQAGVSAITVYSGVQPTAAQVTANWSLYNSAAGNFLVHYQGAAWGNPSYGILLQLTTIPAAVAPTNSGTASWCIIWNTNVTPAAIAGGTLPSASFIVGTVSDGVGQGVVRFSNTSLVAATPVTILDGSFGASSS